MDLEVLGDSPFKGRPVKDLVLGACSLREHDSHQVKELLDLLILVARVDPIARASSARVLSSRLQ